MSIRIRKFIRELMGRQVRFTKELISHFHYDDEINKAVRGWKVVVCDPPEVGWIVGVRWVLTGYTVQTSYPEDPNVFKETQARTMCYLVTTWPTRNSIKVPPDAIEVLEQPVKVHYVDNTTRQLLSEQSKDWPRGPNGRFRK